MGNERAPWAKRRSEQKKRDAARCATTWRWNPERRSPRKIPLVYDREKGTVYLYTYGIVSVEYEKRLTRAGKRERTREELIGTREPLLRAGFSARRRWMRSLAGLATTKGAVYSSFESGSLLRRFGTAAGRSGGGRLSGREAGPIAGASV